MLGFLSKTRDTLLGNSPEEKAKTEVANVLPLAECSPDECQGCTVEFPSSVKIEEDVPLWGSTAEWAYHVLLYSGKTDWTHDIADEQNILGKVVRAMSDEAGKLEKLAGSKVKLNGSSLTNELSSDANESETSMLVLPSFVTISKVTPQNAVELMEKLIRATNENKVKELVANEPDYYQANKDKGYILLCSHRTRDKRCAITAPIMRKQFELQFREHELYRDHDDDRAGGMRVVYINHVGGHKFNANVFIYLNSGECIWMARVHPRHVQPIVEKTILEGKAFPSLMRQCFKKSAVDW